MENFNPEDHGHILSECHDDDATKLHEIQFVVKATLSQWDKIKKDNTFIELIKSKVTKIHFIV